MLDGETVMVIGQQKASTPRCGSIAIFGMANPEGYRKALRLMRLAEKIQQAIVT
jgi:acetyl-CoA carboxylase alpha subunit